MKQEGSFNKGKPFGKWTYYNEDGSVKGIKEY
jgi:hypothetical protein